MTGHLLFMAIGILLTVNAYMAYILYKTTQKHKHDLTEAHKSLLSAVEKIEATTTRVEALETRLGALEARKTPFATVPRAPGMFS